MSDPMSNSGRAFERVREGMEVYTFDGMKLGEVGEILLGTGPGSLSTVSEGANVPKQEGRSHFQVRRGGVLSLGSDLWFPADEIEEVSEERVTLSCRSKDEAEQHGSDSPPAQSS